MASTRNKNTMINYQEEQLQYRMNVDHCLYPYSSGGYAYQLNLPGDGFGASAIPADQLSTNAIDIESFLRGTGLTNLVQGGCVTLTPQLNNICTASIYKKNTIVMPEPLHVGKNRPWPI